MRLQSQDFIMANQIQQELARMVPNDPTIREFARILPDEAAYQESVMREEAQNEEEEEYYDEEDDDGAEDDQDDEEEAAAENADAAANATDSASNAEMTTQASTVAAGDIGGAAGATVEEVKEEEDDEYDSDYDEEGNYVWGQEGADWEFYYQEDKEAYERGESTVPETLNPDALPRAQEISVQTTTATGETVEQLIGVSLARDGAVYRTTKKKLK